MEGFDDNVIEIVEIWDVDWAWLFNVELPHMPTGKHWVGVWALESACCEMDVVGNMF